MPSKHIKDITHGKDWIISLFQCDDGYWCSYKRDTKFGTGRKVHFVEPTEDRAIEFAKVAIARCGS